MIPYKDLHPSGRYPGVTILLIAVNVAVFLYQSFLPEQMETSFIYKYAVIPLELKLHQNLTFSPGLSPLYSVVTAMFLHGGWFHLGGNMLYLWIFGDNVEDRMGHFRFLVFYLLCGIIATFAQVFAIFNSTIPSLGASGAIAGVLAAYLRLFPRAKIAVLIPVFYFLRSIILPAWLVLGGWVLLQVLEARYMSQIPQTSGVAYFAHEGGFMAGLLLTPLFCNKNLSKKT